MPIAPMSLLNLGPIVRSPQAKRAKTTKESDNDAETIVRDGEAFDTMLRGSSAQPAGMGIEDWSALLGAIAEQVAPAEKLDTLVNEVIKTHNLLERRDTDRKGGCDDADDTSKTDREKMLEEASALGGKFDMRKSNVGLEWAKAIRDPSLKKSYEAVGKGYQQQREFRAKWVHLFGRESGSRHSIGLSGY